MTNIFRKKISWFIGMRYLRSKRSNFISFVSFVSITGISLGVAILITVLSVMNGFDEELHQKVFDLTPQLMLIKNSSSEQNSLQQIQSQFPALQLHAPVIMGSGLLLKDQRFRPVHVSGITPEDERLVSKIERKMQTGSIDDLTEGSFRIIISENLAYHFDVYPGDKISLLVPSVRMGPMGMMPVYRLFTVAGMFNGESGMITNDNHVYMHQQDALKLLKHTDYYDGYKFKLKDVYQAPVLARQISKTYSDTWIVRDWTDDYGPFLKAVKMEKTMMFLILLMLIAIAGFNLITSLVMLVNEKKADIAILRTMGAKPSTIVSIFMIQGVSVGSMGTVIGLILGLTLALNVTTFVDWIQTLLRVELFVSSVYSVDHLPSKILISDLMKVCGFAWLMSLLATLYPAWHASKVHPVDILRYE